MLYNFDIIAIYILLYLEPEMWKLNTIVVPQIMAHWEDVAYSSLRYDIPKVKGIKEKHKDDPRKCCRELFIDWLSTENGINPKTWETLLKQLKEVPDLAASVESIAERI